MELPLREQGTLLTNIRSCDVSPKMPCDINERYGCSTGESSPERALVAYLRYLVLVPADEREVEIDGSFFASSPPDPGSWKPSQFGHYPLHWYSHLMHGFEIIGYRHPNFQTRILGYGIYRRLVMALHLKPETREEMINRLSEDRLAAGTVRS